MKIAFVIPGGGGGGVRSVVRIAEGLAARGHAIRILYRQPAPSPRDCLRDFYLRIRHGRRSNWLASFPGEATSYEVLTPNVVGRHDAIVGVGVSCVLEIDGLPETCGTKVHNCRGVEPWIPKQMDAAWRLAMPRIVVGSHLVSLMRQAGSKDPIYVAPNGVDAGSYYPAKCDVDRTAVGAVYHGGGVKDPTLLVATFRRLHELRPGVPLICFGSFPRPRGLRPVEYIRLPSVALARDCYSRCRVWFLTSRNEGLPNPLLEAMACGCAVVSTDCGGSGDIIEHEHTGLLSPVGDGDALLTSILRLLDDDGLRRRLVNNSQNTVRQFNWPDAINAFESALKSIIADAGNDHRGQLGPERRPGRAAELNALALDGVACAMQLPGRGVGP